METELVQLAQEAVAALQAGPPPNWAEIVTAGAAAAGVVVQAVLIGTGLVLMHLSGKRRDTQLDAVSTSLERSGGGP